MKQHLHQEATAANDDYCFAFALGVILVDSNFVVCFHNSLTTLPGALLQAAVVVDDNFSPVGVAYLDDVEEELVRQRMLNERDNNFGNR